MNTEKIFNFGEKVEEFKVPVLNEREVRAGAGILFFFAIISFSNSWFVGDFSMIKIFDIAFLIDFFIRIFINPKFSPSLIIGRFVTSNQKPEYVGAAQKRFAWALGFVLALIMFFLVVLNNIIGPINLFICSLCLIFLFFESAFGICLGCKMYNLFKKQGAILCPGGVCEKNKKEKIQKISIWQGLIVVVFILAVGYITNANFTKKNKEILNIPKENINVKNDAGINIIKDNNLIKPPSNKDCEVPDWAIKIGHEEKWKLHHGCE